VVGNVSEYNVCSGVWLHDGCDGLIVNEICYKINKPSAVEDLEAYFKHPGQAIMPTYSGVLTLTVPACFSCIPRRTL
jgi:hypothetical protein